MFQFLKIKIRRLHASLKGLNSSLAQPADKLWLCKLMQEKRHRCDFKVQVYCTLAPNVLNSEAGIKNIVVYN